MSYCGGHCRITSRGRGFVFMQKAHFGALFSSPVSCPLKRANQPSAPVSSSGHIKNIVYTLKIYRLFSPSWCSPTHKRTDQRSNKPRSGCLLYTYLTSNL